jgi:predicted ferric reductase
MIDHTGLSLARLKNGTPVTVDGDLGEMEYEGTLPDA